MGKMKPFCPSFSVKNEAPRPQKFPSRHSELVSESISSNVLKDPETSSG